MGTEDRLEILQRIAAYSYTFDGKDSEGWANLFAEDGVWDCIIKEQEAPIEHLVGRDAIHAWAVKRHKTIPDTYRSYHHQSGTIFDVLESGSAHTRTMLILTGHDPTTEDPVRNAAQVTGTGVYHDEWVKTSGEWLIKKRTLVM